LLAAPAQVNLQVWIFPEQAGQEADVVGSV
jgi:hypothetical protein